MAKSIHTTIKEDRLEVSHQGEDISLETPDWFRQFDEMMDDEEKLLHVARQEGVLHGLLHAGLQQAVIGMRAAARPVKDGVTWTTEGEADRAQKRLDAYRPKPVPVPGAKKPVSPEAAIAALKAAGLDREAIIALLGKG